MSLTADVKRMYEAWRKPREPVKTFVLRKDGEDSSVLSKPEEPKEESDMSQNDNTMYPTREQLHEQRLAPEQNDINAQLQNVRVAGEGQDIAAFSPEQILQAFDPHGQLTQVELDNKIRYYVEQHSKQDFSGQQRAPVKYQFGFDQTGVQRQARPGEMVDQLGQLQMVNPQYADQMAERMRDVSDSDARQTMRRQAQFRTLATVVLNPVQNPSGPQVQWVDDEQHRNLKQEYIQAKEVGFTDSQMDFLPLFAYAAKLWPEGRQPLRPKLSNECGFFQMANNLSSKLTGSIVCLKSDHFGTKHSLQIQVPRSMNQPQVAPQVLGPTGQPYPAHQQVEEAPPPPYMNQPLSLPQHPPGSQQYQQAPQVQQAQVHPQAPQAPPQQVRQQRQQLAPGVEDLSSGSILVKNPNSPAPQPFPLSQFDNQTAHTNQPHQVTLPSSQQSHPRQVVIHSPPEQLLPPSPGTLPRRG